MKKCGKCGIEKDSSEFGIRSRNGWELKSYCRPCEVQVSRKCNSNNKIAALEHYGGPSCSCCGEKEIAFLALDHANDDGAQQRNTHGSGTSFYSWLKRLNYPDLNLRVLCHNCNLGRYINGGICPHKQV